MARLDRCASCGLTPAEGAQLVQWRPQAPVDSVTVCSECGASLLNLNSLAAQANVARGQLEELERRLVAAIGERDRFESELSQALADRDHYRRLASEAPTQRPRRRKLDEELGITESRNGGPSHHTLPPLPGLPPPDQPQPAAPTRQSSKRGRPPSHPALVQSASDRRRPEPWEAEGITALEYALRLAAQQGVNLGNMMQAVTAASGATEPQLKLLIEAPEPEPDLGEHRLEPHPYQPPYSPNRGGAKVRR